PALLGQVVHVLRLARGDDGPDGQLRADAGASAAGAPRGDARHLLLCGGLAREVPGGRAPLELGDLRGVHGRDRPGPRREHDAAGRPQSPTSRRHGQGRVGAGRHRGRDHYDAGLAAPGAWGWSTTASPTHAGPSGEPVPTRLAGNDERLALARTLGEFNRGVIEILPPSVAKPDEADRKHLYEVALTSGRPVFFLVFDAD